MLVGIDARYGLRKKRRGIGNYIYYLLSEFRRMKPPGFEFVLYVDKTADPEVVEEFRQSSFTIRVLSAINLAWWEQVALPLAAWRDKINLLHCTSNIAPVLFKPCPLITTIHDVIEFRRSEFGDTKLSLRHRLSRAYRMGVLPYVARLSDAIITVSEYSRRDISQILKVPLQKITVTYEAPTISHASLGNIEKTCSLLGIPQKYIFALGALDKRKNTAKLLEAYHQLRSQTNTDVALVVAGIEKPEVFAPLAREGVHLFGFLPDEIIAVLYRHAIFFVYPSLYEGFGLPVLEAMACGTPVICSGTTSVAEVAGEAALKLDPNSISDLSAKMKQLLDNPELRIELARKGILRAKEFSWERCAQDTLSIYRKVMDDTK
ncbi:N-acetylgalactosamine-N,N'-diacetylbacillosaminyl-diphospho-undecaprenol 4-alpha-N-acetylgalactosaminyltransferase [Fervidicola ferrireducens]|uniref:N-acetylgalactosamine-N, N'-diacetylbacillosaminyl-diphospho-undecaprenol 4-alpha-N-acetylgalactosaminyltransferase n=1 Tax=Fervidicola ferrireducens TaxID=520764 RepID=A0A140LCS3_9FIRM|nr:glycosyltransferase family 1 protein [Fervidicola ferrireducens]KXG78348.1 N-acetylgalactosamine-N,N'-diacetylbacillosaminyl-diphospho-undecaprenol 4-alpha-N-acetylgalactosaminyltransferase [Fervidicola ferrireducens]